MLPAPTSLPPPQTRVIQGYEFTFYAMTGLEAWPVFIRLQKILGPTLIAAFGDAGAGLDAGLAARACGKLLEQLAPQDLDQVILPMLAKVTVNGVPVGGVVQRDRDAFAATFGGRFGLLFEVIGVGLEVNFLDFFDVARRAFVGMASTLLAMTVQQEVNRPTTSSQTPA